MSKFRKRADIGLRDREINEPFFKWKSLSVKGNDRVFLTYYSDDDLDDCIFNAKDLSPSYPYPFIIMKEGDTNALYEYHDDVLVDRIKTDKGRIDVITNLDAIINDIEAFIKESTSSE